jgi:hypothetical protein
MQCVCSCQILALSYVAMSAPIIDVSSDLLNSVDVVYKPRVRVRV